jgi:hypothetical protein
VGVLPGRVGRAIGVVLLKSEARAYGDLRHAQQRERSQTQEDR